MWIYLYFMKKYDLGKTQNPKTRFPTQNVPSNFNTFTKQLSF